MGGNCGRIQAEVCDFYGVSLDEMLCERRFPRISRPRQIAMFLCVELTSLSLINLAGRFHRDHTTLLGALKKIRGLLLWDRELQDEIAELRRRCADEVPA